MDKDKALSYFMSPLSVWLSLIIFVCSFVRLLLQLSALAVRSSTMEMYYTGTRIHTQTQVFEIM